MTGVAQFWSRVDRNGPKPPHVPQIGKCWVWMACIEEQGYGRLRVSNRSERAHRIAWSLTHGPVPRTLCVLHRCDNRACVRPSHLFLGTHADNVHDKIRKGRGGHGGVRFLGSQHPAAKLTEQDVVKLRRLHASGRFSQRALARAFGVDQSQVSNIVLRKRWGHVA